MADRGDVLVDGRKLRKIRDLRMETQEDFADAIGVRRNWLNETEVAGQRRVLRSMVRRIAEKLKIDPHELIVPAPIDHNMELGSIQQLADIPMFDLSVACGTWVDVSDVPQVCNGDSIEQGLFRVRLAGDSMMPMYKNGMIIEFKCLRFGEDVIEAGKDYYVQRADGMATFKTVYKATPEKLELRALNRKKYKEPMIVEMVDVVRMARAMGEYKPF
jgi:transcriptional regulator with XRE-family HTH domain